MRDTFLRLKDKILRSENDYPDEYGEDYLEIDTALNAAARDKAKIQVKSFIIKDFTDVKFPLDCLREGYTIVLINIKPLKDKDLIELKRAVNKLKKTCDAIAGDIAGFGEDWIVATPNFAEIDRSGHQENFE